MYICLQQSSFVLRWLCEVDRSLKIQLQPANSVPGASETVYIYTELRKTATKDQMKKKDLNHSRHWQHESFPTSSEQNAEPNSCS